VVSIGRALAGLPGGGPGRAALLWAGLLGLLLAAFGGPLLGVHGVESALLLGVALPPFVAAAASRRTSERLGTWTPPTGPGLLGSAALLGIAVWGLPTVVLGLNGLRLPQCTPGEAFAFLVAGPGVGCVLASWVGVAAGLWLPRRTAAGVAAAVPIISALAEVLGLWTTPAIFAYDHFAGWFPGTLYDRGTSFPRAYLTFRMVTLGLALGLAGVILGALDPDRRRGRLSRLGGRPGATLAALVGAGVFALGTAYGPALGHASSVAAIVEALGATERGDRCTLHAPEELDPATRRRLVDDCDFRVWQVERDLGVDGTPRVTAFLFRSAGEKRRFMGAAGTLIAKPWRHEVYLQNQGWPHPVMHHEVAHVVAGQVAPGPLALAGSLGGWVPDPALIEGTAVALAFRSRWDLTPHQWSRALLELDRLPPLARLSGPRFLLQSPRDAYTVMGSFLRFVLDTQGAEAVRRIYRQGGFPGDLDRDALEAAWRRFLSQEAPLPAGALERAKQRFGRPSVFATACPHRVARLERRLVTARNDGRYAEVVERATEILRIDPGRSPVIAARAGALARLGEMERAAKDLRVLEGAPAPVRATALELVADAAWARGDLSTAGARYDALLDLPRDDGEIRALQVKTLGVRQGGQVGVAVRRLLVPMGGHSAPTALAVHLAHRLDELAATPEGAPLGGLGAYLEGRQLYFAEAYPDALARFDAALEAGLPTAELRLEARRLAALAAFAGADQSIPPGSDQVPSRPAARRDELREAERRAVQLRADPAADPATRGMADDLLDRIVHARQPERRPGAAGAGTSGSFALDPDPDAGGVRTDVAPGRVTPPAAPRTASSTRNAGSGTAPARGCR